MLRCLAVALAALLALPATAQPDDEDRPPFELRVPQPGDGPLSVYLRLQEADGRFDAGSAASSFVRGQLSQIAGGLGMHGAALRWTDVAYAIRPDSVGTLPPGTHALDAVEAVLDRVGDTRAVMVNEAHHDASTRLLTLRLLAPLYDRGFRYLAAEDFAPDSILSTVAAYPTLGMGFYADEPVFGALIREALRLGYTLVPYDDGEDPIEGDTLTSEQRREVGAAQRIVTRVFDRDPDARVLVHAGYGHINEAPTEYFSPMAWYFREATGIDPLTVNQTDVWLASDTPYEHPLYRAAEAAGLLADRSVVLVDRDDELVPVDVGDAVNDLYVIRPATGRPVEALGYGTIPQLSLPEACGACVVEVRRADEGPDAVPVDRTVAFAGGTAGLLGPRDVPLVVTVIEGRTGRELNRRITFAR